MNGYFVLELMTYKTNIRLLCTLKLLGVGNATDRALQIKGFSLGYICDVTTPRTIPPLSKPKHYVSNDTSRCKHNTCDAV